MSADRNEINHNLLHEANFAEKYVKPKILKQQEFKIVYKTITYITTYYSGEEFKEVERNGGS
jgi:hypothetical protein